MKSSIPLSVIFAFGLYLCGCTKIQTECEEVYRIEDTDKTPIAEIFSTIELIPLEFAGNDYPNSVQDLRICDGRLLIKDNHNTIYAFADDGRYYGCSNNVLGQGPEEYAISMGYGWNSITQSIEIITPNELLCYDDHFKTLRQKSKIPTTIGKNCLLFNNIYDISSTQHLLIPTGISEQPFGVFLYDSANEKISKIFSYDKDVIAPQNMQGLCFVETVADGVLFCPPALSEYIYGFNPEDLSFYRKIRTQLGRDYIGSTNIPKEVHTDSEIFTSGKYLLLKKLVSGNRVLFLFSSGLNAKNMHITIVDRVSESVPRTLSLFQGEYLKLPIMYFMDNDYAYSVLDIETIREQPFLLSELRNIGTHPDSIESDSFVLLKYKFNHSR